MTLEFENTTTTTPEDEQPPEKPEEIEFLVSKGYLVKHGGKYFKMRRQTYKRDGRTVSKEIYEEVDLNHYEARVQSLAERICQFPNVKIIDVVRDALHDYELDKIRDIEHWLDKELDRAAAKSVKADVKTEPGHCTELCIGIGKKHSFVLRQ